MAPRASRDPRTTTGELQGRLVSPWGRGSRLNCSVAPAQIQPSRRSRKEGRKEGNLCIRRLYSNTETGLKPFGNRFCGPVRLEPSQVCLENERARMLGLDAPCFVRGRGKNGFDRRSSGSKHVTIPSPSTLPGVKKPLAETLKNLWKDPKRAASRPGNPTELEKNSLQQAAKDCCSVPIRDFLSTGDHFIFHLHIFAFISQDTF